MVTADSFIKAFFEVVEKEQDNIDARLGSVDKNKNRTELYTEYMMDTILSAIADKLDCRYENEKYNLDAVFYSNEENNNRYFHVAIEHENTGDRAHQELEKLSLFNVPLKVLITYLYCGKDNVDSFLTQWSKSVISEMDHFKDFADKRRQLLIIGRRNPYETMENQSEIHKINPAWTSYIWNGEKFDRFS